MVLNLSEVAYFYVGIAVGRLACKQTSTLCSL